MLIVLFGCEQNSQNPPESDGLSQALIECGAAGKEGAPVNSIGGVVDRINALPRPTSGACLVASLPRPLQVVATSGTISAQPAGECDEAALAEHPDALCDARVFLLVPGVVIAVVPSGAGSKAIELGEWVSTTRTLKAEIALPVTGELPASEPFTRLLSGGVTACALCHAEEKAHPTIEHGYVSAAYRPVPRTSPASEGEIGLEVLRAQHQACARSKEVSERCDMFHALFDFGDVEQGAFGGEVDTFVH